MFEIDTKLIQSLNDEIARELIARLCRAELRAQGLSDTGVTWGGDQRAKDGGVDVRVEASEDLPAPSYVLKRMTAFQVKAEVFTPGKIPEEMAPNGIPRPAIVGLAGQGGAYIIASTRDNTSNSALTDRINAMKTTATAVGYGGIKVAFYGARQIADWLEHHPSIVTWLRSRIGQPIVGWRPYGPWAYGETDLSTEFIQDEKRRVRAPGTNHLLTPVEAISRLRKELSSPASIRIVGLSGVGKTRLVQAIFDNRIETEPDCPPPDDVIYADTADALEPSPHELISRISESGSSATIVVDNCSSDLHDRLAQIVKLPNNKTKLITVEYDIRDDLPAGTSSYSLEGASDEAIRTLLSRRFQLLSDPDAERVTLYSDGNARVACALASTASMTGELAGLRDAQLFDRLFHQRNAVDPLLLRTAQAATLVYSFDGESVEPDGELATLARLAGLDEITFYQNLATLKARGLLQSRGPWRAVLPHAIANRLAHTAFSSSPVNQLKDRLLLSDNHRLARSFARRLGYLHDHESARTIAREVLSDGGILGRVCDLSDIQVEIFENIAPVDLTITLEALERAATEPPFLGPENPYRHTYLRIIFSLAYDPTTFQRAAELLVKFSICERGNPGSERPSSKLQNLFQIFFSGTTVSAEVRRNFLLELIRSGDDKRHQLALECVSHALETSQFSSGETFSFGARSRSFGWQPTTQEEVAHWYKVWIEFCAELGARTDQLGAQAREVLGMRLRGLWNVSTLDDLLLEAGEKLAVLDGWPHGWLGLKRLLHWDRDSLSQDSLAKAEQLEGLLAPSDLQSEVQAKIVVGCDFHALADEGDDNEYPDKNVLRRAERAANDLGKRVAETGDMAISLLPDLLSKGRNGSIFSFGKGIGAQMSDPWTFLRAARATLAECDPRETSLIALRGFLRGWREQSPGDLEVFLDEALNDPVWIEWFVELQCVTDLDDKSHARLVAALHDRRCPTWQFSYLSLGRATEPLSVEQIFEILSLLLDRPETGAEVAIDLLGMVVHGTDRKGTEYQNHLAVASLAFLSENNWLALLRRNAQVDHDVGTIYDFALARCSDLYQIQRALEHIVPSDGALAWRQSDTLNAALRPFFKRHPKMALDCVWSIDTEKPKVAALRIVSPQFSAGQSSLVSEVEVQALIDWCREGEGEERFEFAAATCELFVVDKDEETAISIHEAPLRLLRESTNKIAVLEQLKLRFHPSGWSGSLADVLERRRALIPTLDPDADADLSLELKKFDAELAQQIDQERQRQAREDASATATFE